MDWEEMGRDPRASCSAQQHSAIGNVINVSFSQVSIKYKMMMQYIGTQEAGLGTLSMGLDCLVVVVFVGGRGARL